MLPGSVHFLYIRAPHGSYLMNIVIYGATSRIAHECARLWARDGHRMVLLGRDAARLEEVAADLRVASPQVDAVRALAIDVQNENGLHQSMAALDREIGGINLVLIAHGSLPEQAKVQRDAATLRQALEVNVVSVAQLCEAAASVLERRPGSTLAVIGSVAGDRGRQSNYAYGASKGFVERYCQGLRNRLYPMGVAVVLIKPGPTDTPMTRGHSSPEGGRLTRLADPVTVARCIVAGIGARRSTVYAPGRWRWIMMVIRSIPERVFVRLKL
jgi:decaprenylphospho-beta-D-erythro-pentofuranosid-2-ulose 2-reductase